MFWLRGCLLVAVLLSGCRALGNAEEPSPPTADETGEAPTASAGVDKVNGAIEQYRQAYEVMSVQALGEIYAQSLDLELVFQGKRLRGWSAVEAHIQELFGGATSVRLVLEDVNVVMTGAGAVATAKLERNVGDGTATTTVTGVLTLVFREDLTGFSIVAEHFSY